MDAEVKNQLTEIINLLKQRTLLMKNTGDLWKAGSKEKEFFLYLERFIFIVGLNETGNSDSYLYVQIRKIQGEIIFLVKIPESDTENYQMVMSLYKDIIDAKACNDVKSLSQVLDVLKKN